jgi:hypothetical protein
MANSAQESLGVLLCLVLRVLPVPPEGNTYTPIRPYGGVRGYLQIGNVRVELFSSKTKYLCSGVSIHSTPDEKGSLRLMHSAEINEKIEVVVN